MDPFAHNALDINEDRAHIVYSPPGRGAGLILGIIFFSSTFIYMTAYISGEKDFLFLMWAMLILLPIDTFIFLLLFIRIKVTFDNQKLIKKTFSLFNKPLKYKYYDVRKYKEIILCKAVSGDSGSVGPRNWLIVLNAKIPGHLQIELCSFQSSEDAVIDGMKVIENIIQLPFRDERNVGVGSHGPYFK
jgi:hypothetical protein